MAAPQTIFVARPRIFAFSGTIVPRNVSTVISCNPDNAVIATSEKWVGTFDFSNILSPTQSIQSVTSTLFDITNNPATNVTITNGPTFAGNLVTQGLLGSDFPNTNHDYRLSINAVISTATPPITLSLVLNVYVPF